MMLGGAGALLLGALGMTFTAAMPALFALRVAQALGYVAFTTASTALIADLAAPQRRGLALARFGIAANVAVTLTPALVGAALPALTIPGAFWLAGALALGGGLLAALIRYTPAGSGAPTSTGEREAKTSIRAHPRLSAPWQDQQRQVAAALGLPMVAAALLGIGFGAFLQFLPLLAARRGNIDAGLIYASYGVAIIGTRLLLGRWLDRANMRRVLGSGFVALALGLILFALAQSWPLLLLATALVAAGGGMLHPALIALHVAIMPAQARGKATACFYLAFDLGIGGGAWLLGFVLQWWGLTWLYLVAALAACLGSLVAWRLRADERSQRSAVSSQ
jgi:MFS family permease